MRSTEIIIPRQSTYDLPEGRFTADITGVVIKPGKSGKGENCYIHFGVQVLGMENHECCARAIFPLDTKPGSPLSRFLERLLGKEFFTKNSNQSVKLDQVLKGKKCEIELIHGQHDEKYDWPLVIVDKVDPVSLPTEEGGQGQ